MSLRSFFVYSFLCTALFCVGCSSSSDNSTGGDQGLAGKVAIDGSSTVYPVSEAVAEEFSREHSGVQITVGKSGTGGGFKKFYQGDTDISDASRPIKDSERQLCEQNGVEYIELEVTFDGLAVVANPENEWCDCLTVEQLKKIWEPESSVKNWSDIDPEWPDEKIKLYGPGTDSGTFDYFTEVIVGESRASRADYTASEDDNMLVTGVQSGKNALGYFGYAYYEENKSRLKLLAVDAEGNGNCVKPATETVRDNSYAPLSRPLYIYVRKDSLQRPEVAEFVRFYLANAAELSSAVGYVPVSDEVAAENQRRLDEALAVPAVN